MKVIGLSVRGATAVAIMLVLAVVIVAVTLDACGGGQSNKGVSLATGTLDERVPRIPQGASVAAIESRLGVPVSTATVGDETVLSYGLWRLVVEGDHLARQIRSRRTGHTDGSGAGDREGKRLDRKVLRIKRGTSIADVKAMLGVPEHDEEVFEGTRQAEVILSFGAWILSFRNGELRQRTKF